MTLVGLDLGIIVVFLREPVGVTSNGLIFKSNGCKEHMITSAESDDLLIFVSASEPPIHSKEICVCPVPTALSVIV